MKLKDGFVTHSLAGKNVLITVGPAAKSFNGLVELNDTAAFIVEKLKSETTVDNIAKELTEEFDVDFTMAKSGVESFVQKIRGIGALEE